MPLRLRTSTSRRKGVTYTYHQLVRAVRRDGSPTHEVVAHLGRLSEPEAAALRRGLATLKADAVAEAGAQAGEGGMGVRVRLEDILALGALRYLDLMVVRSAWNDWKLSDFFEEHLPSGGCDVSPSDVVFVLVANRCVAPCSKLRVTEWVPRTCLPQLLAFASKQFNNTRIHRVLAQLEGMDPALSRFLVDHPTRRRRLDSVVFLDLTNTWFEGHGGTLGQRSKTKDGAIRRHVVQIALGVDAHGLPLQWEVLPGKTAEVNVLPSWIESLRAYETLRDLPLVFDRGLTSEENLSVLVQRGRRFVTCARESQIEKWKTGVDLDALARLNGEEAPDRKTLEAAHLQTTDDEDIYHVDQGVVRPPLEMKSLSERGLRVVPYFRPSLFVRNRDSLERLCRNVEAKITAINEELRGASRSRTEEAVRRRIDQLLDHFGVQAEYSVRLVPLEIIVANDTAGGEKPKGHTKTAKPRKPVHSFQVFLDRVATPSLRKQNAGWMVLLAHPDDQRPALDLIRQYHQKAVVEHAFGVIKSFVDLRPIHHQTDPKIRAHVTLCVLALLLDRYLELKLHDAGVHEAIDRVYEALEPCRLQVLTDRRRRATRFTITRAGADQVRLLESLGLSRLLDEEAAPSFGGTARRT